MDDGIAVEVAYAAADRQILRRVALPAGSTVLDAITASGVIEDLQLDASALDIGIWSKRASTVTPLNDGDRVEIYRRLTIDPMTARRARAARRKR